MRKEKASLPRILVIDDILGRGTGSPNQERQDFCGHLLIRDRTGDQSMADLGLDLPLAEAVFVRGQRPYCAKPGDLVENDLPAVMSAVESGWDRLPSGTVPWSLIIVDLCFLTGIVPAVDDSHLAGVPHGTHRDRDPDRYFGLEILRQLQRSHPGLPVVVLSGMDPGEVSRELALRGGLAFLDKGSAQASLRFEEILNHHGLFADPEGEIVGSSRGLLQALRAARRAAARDGSVLLRGETGTGKELFARFVHRSDRFRRKAAFVAVDAGVLSPELYGSELFGHKRGAFTGALADRVGRMEEAEGGTLFLDEIGNLPEEVQRGLLRVLETKEVVPIGGRAGRLVDMRFLSATNVDIEARAAGGAGFRLDLLERLRTAGTIVLPPLRTRIDDLPALTERFVRKAERLDPLAARRTIDESALEALSAHDWPGNIRELRSTLTAAVLDHPGVDHLVAGHIKLRHDREARRRADYRTERPVGTPAQPDPPGSASLAEILSAIEALDPNRLAYREFAGSLPQVLMACGDLVGRLLRRGAELQKRPTPKSPDGDLRPQPTIQWLLGDSTLDATAAYDTILRLRKAAGKESRCWQDDSVLRDLVERASVRRRRPKARRNPGREGT